MKRCSTAWLDQATVEQTETDTAAGYGYGFYFWIVDELKAYAMWGHGGQLVLMMPEQELTLVLTSMPDSGDDIGSELEDEVELAKILIGPSN